MGPVPEGKSEILCDGNKSVRRTTTEEKTKGKEEAQKRNSDL